MELIQAMVEMDPVEVHLQVQMLYPTGSAISNQTYEMTLGTANLSNATNNVCLVRIALASGESVSALSIGTPA